MNNKLNRSDFPPAIGTIEVSRDVDGDLTTTEVPIIETYELRGEWFGVHLDFDYFEAMCGADIDDSDICGDYAVTHVGTGCKFTHCDYGGPIEHVKAIVETLWRKYDFCDLYEVAKSKGCAPVRGTVLPIEEMGLQSMTIESKRVLRFYAPYISTSGTRRKKGFATRMSAARFLAKQALFDLVFGEKTAHVVRAAFDDGYTIWKRDVPESKEERSAMFAKHFPLEECPEHHSDIWPGADDERTCDCEQYGYSRCNTREFMIQRTKEIMACDLATS